MTETRDIETRLLNWAAWATSSEGGGGATNMTAVIHDNGRRENGLDPVPPSQPGPRIDSADAYLVARAMISVTLDQRRLLGLHYVDAQRKGWIAARLGFHVAQFEGRLEEARAAIEVVLG